jgi:subtilase family serine protease
MRTRCNAVAVILLVIASAFGSSAETTARIAQSVDSRRMVSLKGNVHPLPRTAVDQGVLDPSAMLDRVTIVFQRTPEQQQALDQLLQDQQNPKSPMFHKWLTPTEFGAKFGLAASDIAKIKDWLTAQGFHIDEIPPSGSYISFSGSAGQIRAAFQTELHQYVANGQVHFANATEPAVPAALAGVVAGIRSLNDFKPKARAIAHRVKPNFTSGISGNNFVTPDDFAAIYNLKALYSSGIDGSGQKIAVVGQSDIDATKIATFRAVSGLPASAPQVTLVPGSGDPGIVSGDVDEASLDIEWAGAVARKAQILYINSGRGAFDSLVYAITNNVAPVLSISYGDCEPNISSTDRTSLEALFQQAAGQGQTIVGPSGDTGAADCDYSTTPNVFINSATHGLAVDYPGSSAYVTSIGGTTFNEGANPSDFWLSTNNSVSGSALFYIPEEAWNDTSASVAAGQGLSGTGGGVSSVFPKPAWQTGTGVPGDGFRDVPDISLNASPGHDGFVICSQGDCNVCFPGSSTAAADPNCPTSSSPGYRITAAAGTTQWALDVIGGTSAGVPTFAGLVALINQKTGSSQGLVNPRLYVLAASQPYVFHDVTVGDNKVPCTAGTTDCPSGGTIGYTAGTGYDLVTGLGSVDGFNLVSNWTAGGTADFGITFFNASVTIAKGGSASVPVILQRQNGFNGTVTLACSTAVAGVTCSVSPGTVNPDGTTAVTINVSSSASLRTPGLGSPLVPWWTSAFGVAALFGIGAGKKRSRRQWFLLGLLVLALLLSVAGCGGGSSSSTGSTGGTGGSGGSSGNVTITGTSGSLAHSANIALTIQ